MHKGKFCSEMIKSFVQTKGSLYIFVDVIQVKTFFFLFKCQQLTRVRHPLQYMSDKAGIHPLLAKIAKIPVPAISLFLFC